MVISVGARLLLGTGPRPAPLRFFGAYLALVFFADTTYSIQSLDGTYRAGNFLDAIWICSGLLLAAGVLHPALPKMTEQSAVGTPDATVGRLALLALAATVAPTTVIVQSLRHGSANALLAACVCNVLFLLVMARMVGLVRAPPRSRDPGQRRDSLSGAGHDAAIAARQSWAASVKFRCRRRRASRRRRGAGSRR